jgi:cytochrome c oxidase assembly factor CtaG
MAWPAAQPAAAGPAQTLLSPLLLLVYAIPYYVRTRTLRRRGAPVPAWRQACFAGALLLLLIAVSPPVDRLADERLSWHMTEHLVIGDIAPLLVVLACTGPVIAPLMRLPLTRPLRVLSHPVVAFSLWAADLYLWHLAFAYDGALRHDVVHVFEHACFFVFGVILWLPLFGPLPKPAWFTNLARLGYILAVRFTGTILANAFIWSGAVFYNYYGAPETAHGVNPLSDQGVAGGVMLVEQSIVTLCLFAWLFMRTAADLEERQELAELAAARGYDVDERRIARAVTAGRGDALRRRIVAGSRPDSPADTSVSAP